MENFVLFVITVITYSAIWFCWDGPKTVVQYAKRVALMALLCVPLNINGNVFTVIGNATAEKSIYSVLSLYQKAGDDAVNVIGLAGYQRAGHDVWTLVGLVGYQWADNTALTGFGLAGCQQANRYAGIFAGLAGYQWADKGVVNGIGFTGYQRSSHAAQVIVGIAFYQKVGEKTRTFTGFSEPNQN